MNNPDENGVWEVAKAVIGLTIGALIGMVIGFVFDDPALRAKLLGWTGKKEEGSKEDSGSGI